MSSTEAFDRRRFELLEHIARGAPLAEVLDGLVRLLEDQGGGVLGSIHLIDRDRACIRRGAAQHGAFVV